MLLALLRLCGSYCRSDTRRVEIITLIIHDVSASVDEVLGVAHGDRGGGNLKRVSQVSIGVTIALGHTRFEVRLQTVG